MAVADAFAALVAEGAALALAVSLAPLDPHAGKTTAAPIATARPRRDVPSNEGPFMGDLLFNVDAA